MKYGWFVLVCTLALLTIPYASKASERRVVRATELGTLLSDPRALLDAVVEFREGDVLPVQLTAKGDLLETVDDQVAHVRVRKNFWVKANDREILLSWDGTNFTPIQKALTGNLTIGAGAPSDGGTVSAINVLLQAFIKN